MHNIKNSSLNNAIVKATTFLSQIDHFISKKSNSNDFIRKKLFVRTARRLLLKVNEPTTISTSSGDSLRFSFTTSDTNALLVNNSLSLSDGIPPIIPPSNSHSVRMSIASAGEVEVELEELSSTLFEEASKIVAVEKEKNKELKERILYLESKLNETFSINSDRTTKENFTSIISSPYQSSNTTNTASTIDILNPFNKNKSFLSLVNSTLFPSVNFTEFKGENEKIFKSFSQLNINERIFIDGMLLNDFQEFLTFVSKLTISHNPSISSIIPSNILLGSTFVKRIVHHFVEPTISTLKGVKSNSVKKRLLDNLQKKTFDIKRANSDEVSGKCILCGIERVCEFYLSLQCADSTGNYGGLIDRFCRDKINAIASLFQFITKNFTMSVNQPLLLLFRTLIRHLHQISICYAGGVSISNDTEDSIFPDIEIIN